MVWDVIQSLKGRKSSTNMDEPEDVVYSEIGQPQKGKH